MLSKLFFTKLGIAPICLDDLDCFTGNPGETLSRFPLPARMAVPVLLIICQALGWGQGGGGRGFSKPLAARVNLLVSSIRTAEDAIAIVDPNASQWDTLFHISTLHGGGTRVEMPDEE